MPSKEYYWKNKEKLNAAAKVWRDNNREMVNDRHRRSYGPYIHLKYRKIKDRVEGKHVHKAKYYLGKELMSYEDFKKWAYSEPHYTTGKAMWQAWIDSGFEMKLSPSVDRIDSSKGYIEGNLQWLTMSENGRKGAHLVHYGVDDVKYTPNN